MDLVEFIIGSGLRILIMVLVIGLVVTFGLVRKRLQTQAARQISQTDRLVALNFLKLKYEEYRKQNSDQDSLEAPDWDDQLNQWYPLMSQVSPSHWEQLYSYITHGYSFGEAVSYIGIAGKCIDFDELLEDFAVAERAYAEAGYKPVSVDAFERAAGWGRPLEGIGVRLKTGEEPILHAEVFKRHFGDIDYPSRAAQAFVSREPVIGQAFIPSTEMALKSEQRQQ